MKEKSIVYAIRHRPRRTIAQSIPYWRRMNQIYGKAEIRAEAMSADNPAIRHFEQQLALL